MINSLDCCYFLSLALHTDTPVYIHIGKRLSIDFSSLFYIAPVRHTVYEVELCVCLCVCVCEHRPTFFSRKIQKRGEEHQKKNNKESLLVKTTRNKEY